MAESTTKTHSTDHHLQQPHPVAKRRRLSKATSDHDKEEERNGDDENPNLAADIDDFVPEFDTILPFRYSAHRLADLYDLGRELGRGSGGVIRLCTCRSSGELYACKTISKGNLKSKQHISDVAMEVSNMTCLSQDHLLHDRDGTRASDRGKRKGSNNDASATSSSNRNNNNHNVVRLYQVVEDEESVHMVLELCRGGDLFDRLEKKGPFSEEQAAVIMRKLMVAVRYSHSLGIMHRDIKAENILFVEESPDSCDIRLADFGMGEIFAPGMTHTRVLGTAYYIAPEMLQRPCYNEQVDVWSCGVVLYILLSGQPPFWGLTDEATWESIVSDDLEFPKDLWKNISFSAKNLISEMLCKDPEMRMTPAEVLAHPWIKNRSRSISQQPMASRRHTGSSIPSARKPDNFGAYARVCQ